MVVRGNNSSNNLGKRSFSTKATQLVPPQASKVYKDADKDKLRIVSENKGKAGVYRWTNLLNGKFYIGSSVNLSKRFRDYYSIRFLEKEIKKNNSIIYRSLFKHGYSSFSLEILEYCDKSEIISREQYYIDQLNWVQYITYSWFFTWIQTFSRDNCEIV
jgi:hypothetical protein